MGAARLRRVSSRKELENMVDDYVTQGYEVLDQGERTTMLRKKTWGTAGGHVLWALLTVWWTLGIGNLIYALVAHYGADRVMLKMDEPAV
jgi:hypothetical protein